MAGVSLLVIIQSYWGVVRQRRSRACPLPQIVTVGGHWMPRLRHPAPRRYKYGSVPDTRYLSLIVLGYG